MAAPTARVLIAEPDRLQLQLIDMLLAPGGFELVMVQTGREALEHLKATSPDVALLALDLPDLAGDAICGKIRRVTRLARMPVILVAPQAGQFGLSDEARARARKVGADLVLPRPLGDKNLRERVRALVDARESTPYREGYTTRIIEEALEELPEEDATPEQTPGPGAAPEAIGEADLAQSPPARHEGDAGAFDGRGPSTDASGRDLTGRPLHHELETLRLENRQLKRKLAEKQAALDSGVNPPLQQKITELERRNRALLDAIEELKGGRDDERGGGLFGRKR